MKRFLTILSTALLALSLCVFAAIPTFAEGTPSVELDGKLTDWEGVEPTNFYAADFKAWQGSTPADFYMTVAFKYEEGYIYGYILVKDANKLVADDGSQSHYSGDVLQLSFDTNKDGAFTTPEYYSFSYGEGALNVYRGGGEGEDANPVEGLSAYGFKTDDGWGAELKFSVEPIFGNITVDEDHPLQTRLLIAYIDRDDIGLGQQAYATALTDSGKDGFNLTLNANGTYAFEVETFTLTYKFEGIEHADETAEYRYNTKVDIDLSKYTPDAGYEFVALDSNGKKITSVTMTGDMTVTILYKELTYTVTLKNGNATVGTFEVSQKTGNFAYTDLAAVNAPTKAGGTFKGWSLTENGAIISADIKVTADTTLYAVFDIETYTLTIKFDGVNRANEVTTYEYGQRVTLDRNKYAVEGYDVTILDANGRRVTSVTIVDNTEVTVKYTAKSTDTGSSSSQKPSSSSSSSQSTKKGCKGTMGIGATIGAVALLAGALIFKKKEN